MDRATRRAVLGGGAVLLSALAGCSSFSVEQGTETGGSGSDAQNLDLREANVTEVTIEDQGDGAYRFDVTLYHDDDGEDGYADWWQVETLEGERLGRRDLLHAHSTEPFTRSETISVPGRVSCVVVRGHDQTHGYGGRALTVSLPGGEVNAVDQGSDRRAVDETDCP
ncbi:hypothetical protein [Haloarcula salinisoli]|uniref:Uncharacterized protein n=1 Tax=Haloarcula salinisoli TaxID=2487746 RepID=A0A8J7YCE0_9EURY|nr:hypothetical protein [Halomicroarcula salinisoli]MBX0285173.1 hypothetical protein [Halomicroarcula salinisoli]MBX0303350.1 hypothetical protein [Halomicroarcula salinisoli]